jgi:GxxExxY protein
LESVYQAALSYELEKRKISYARQKEIIVRYDDELLDIGFRADIIMGEKSIIEIKSVEHLEMVHHKTTLTYIKLTD